MESAESKSNTAAGDGGVDKSEHHALSSYTRHSENQICRRRVTTIHSLLVVPVRGKPTHVSWSIKQPSYCGCTEVYKAVSGSRGWLGQCGAQRITQQTTTESGETTINIVTIISCDTGTNITNIMLSWEHVIHRSKESLGILFLILIDKRNNWW